MIGRGAVGPEADPSDLLPGHSYNGAPRAKAPVTDRDKIQ